MEHDALLVLASVGALGIAGQWLAWRLRLPSILVLLVAGAAVGQAGLLEPDELLGDLLFPVVSLSVALILFEGSLGLGRAELRAAGRATVALCTVGAAITFGVLWAAGVALLGLDSGIAALVAANLVVTGPTVIGPLLQQVRPRGRVGSILRAEGIIIDPIGAALAIVVFEVLVAAHADGGSADTVATLVTIGVVGIGVGSVAAAFLVVALSRFWLPDHVRQPAIVAAVLFTFAAADHFQQESGLVAVTTLGLALANQERVDLDAVLELAESLQVLVLSSLFLLLAAGLDLSVVRADLAGNLVLLGVAVLVARPLAVAVATVGSRLRWRERAFVAAVAPRGIVAAAIASVFAIRLEQAGIPGAERFAGAVVTVLVGTIVVYGLSARWVSVRLGVAEEDPTGVLIVGAHGWGQRLAEVLAEQGLRTRLVDRDRASVVTARLAGRDAVHGSILSPRLREALDLEGIGTLLALTRSDEVNGLAVERLRNRFGRSNTWQLAPQDDEHQVGRVLRWPEAAEIEHQLATGGRLRASRLSDAFDWDAYQERHPDLDLLGVIRANRLLLPADDRPVTPAPGDVLIAISANEAEALDGEPS